MKQRQILSITTAVAMTFWLPAPSRADNQMLNQGIQEFRTGNYSDAAGHLGAALTTDFNNAVLHYYLGSCYVKLNQKQSAVREFRIAYALQPEEEVGKLSRQALAVLGAETNTGTTSNIDVSSMFVPPALPKTTIPPNIQAAGGAELAEYLARLQVAYSTRAFAPPNNGRDHSSSLQPLASNWLPGQTFDDSNLPACNCDGPWYKIPNWLAGTWVAGSESVTQSYHSDYKQKTETRGEILAQRSVPVCNFGVVCDKQGVYWDHPCVPSVTRRSAGKGALQIDMLVQVRPADVTTEKVCLYKRWLRFTLGADRHIRCALQGETISTYVPIGTSYCQNNESEKEFDEKGLPLRASRYRSVIKLAHPPRLPYKDSAGHDFLSMFRRFLTDAKMTDIMP